MKKNILILTLIILVCSGVTYGQESDANPGVKRTGGTYANLFKFEFKPGKTDEGLAILNSTLIPAFEAAGVKVTIIEDLMGAKDVMALIELEDGPSFYEFTVPRQDLRLFTELIRISGSEEEAEKRLNSFINLLVRQTQTLVFVNNGQ